MAHDKKHDGSTQAAEYDKLRAKARDHFRESYRAELVEKLENTWMSNPNLAEFDALILELKEMGIPMSEIRQAFQKAKADYERFHKGEIFPFRQPV